MLRDQLTRLGFVVKKEMSSPVVELFNNELEAMFSVPDDRQVAEQWEIWKSIHLSKADEPKQHKVPTSTVTNTSDHRASLLVSTCRPTWNRSRHSH